MSDDALRRSIQRILALPDQTQLFTGYDYQPGVRVTCESTVAQQKAENAHVRGRDKANSVTLRTERDRTLPMPKLILKSPQGNIPGGRLPEVDNDGRRYFKVPLSALGDAPWD